MQCTRELPLRQTQQGDAVLRIMSKEADAGVKIPDKFRNEQHQQLITDSSFDGTDLLEDTKHTQNRSFRDSA